MAKLYIIFIILFISNSSFGQEQKAYKYKKYKTILGAQFHPTLGFILDLQDGYPLQLIEAGYKPENMDIAFFYGRNTGVNLMTVASTSFSTFGDDIKNKIELWGNKRNQGTLLGLGNDEDAQKTFENIKSNEDIQKSFDYWLLNISRKDFYNNRSMGPSDNLKNLKQGDIILFNSDNKKLSFAIKILNVTISNKGEMELEIKGPSNKKQKSSNNKISYEIKSY